MQIRYENDLRGISWERCTELFQAVGWGTRAPEDIRRAFEKSTFVRIAFDQDKIVGFGRTVDDGKYYALIADLIVDPAYQGKGIGTRILKELKDQLAGFLFTTLTAAPGKDGFYLSRGWKKQTAAFIWPRSQSQAKLYAQEPPTND